MDRSAADRASSTPETVTGQPTEIAPAARGFQPVLRSPPRGQEVSPIGVRLARLRFADSQRE